LKQWHADSEGGRSHSGAGKTKLGAGVKREAGKASDGSRVKDPAGLSRECSISDMRTAATVNPSRTRHTATIFAFSASVLADD
jgi:hypothetical protein